MPDADALRVAGRARGVDDVAERIDRRRNAGQRVGGLGVDGGLIGIKEDLVDLERGEALCEARHRDDGGNLGVPEDEADALDREGGVQRYIGRMDFHHREHRHIGFGRLVEQQADAVAGLDPVVEQMTCDLIGAAVEVPIAQNNAVADDGVIRLEADARFFEKMIEPLVWCPAHGIVCVLNGTYFSASHNLLLPSIVKKDDISYFSKESSALPLLSYPYSTSLDDDRTCFDSNRLIAVDTIRVDEHSRLTFTKKVKNVFPIVVGDTIVVYQDKYNKKELLFKIQRGNNIVDNWIVKRKDVDGIDKNPPQASNVNAKKEIAYNDKNTITYHNNENKIPSIIVIDDEQDIVYNFKTILSYYGYNVKSFTDSKEALKHIIEMDYSSSNTITITATSSQSNHYDLAIIDIRMPHINGIQLYQILKIINKDIKVLFVSALEASQEILSMFPEVKPSSIIKKPISMEYLIEKVQENINSNRN